MSPKSNQDAPEATTGGETGSRLYRQLAQKLIDQLTSGQYAVGDRLPPERDLALEYNVSRPTLREAIIALEVQGFVEVRVGSGAYVTRIPGSADQPGFHVTAFELTEARLAIEGEAAALAAVHISSEELDALDALVQRIEQENRRPDTRTTSEPDADRAFHLAIADATRNSAISSTIEQLWRMRASSPDTALLLEKARAAKVKPVVAEHRAIAQALRSRDPQAARAAMRAHLAAVLDHLLFATEEVAVEQARRTARTTRERFAAQLAPGEE
ncbi:FadR family transcriptional regulator [Sphingobium sufflavum]|uniref:FadR/GntR family transcriptional regulator n=1 Tax=Sphingobium sufflavum TaxID=1129547 RepID=UPI001F1BD50B|nr:FadR/GntR family transcriptional regulator [Sphingobium sufflavum]MCE7796325.1 FadR family transcriptional regulator [Sphingobium sufflavum]